MTRAAFIAAMLAGCSPEAGDLRAATTPITKGEVSSADPSVVALVRVPLECGATERATFCTGTLIAPRVVLTAAHCFDSASAATTKVYVGADVVRAPGEWLAVRELRAHPGWDGRRNDLGAVILEVDATIAPSKLATEHTPTAGDLVRVLGFGADDTGRVGGKRSGTARITTSEATVFSIEAAPGMSCSGDSGGPVFATRDGVEELVAVTSYGDTECRIGFNTRVPPFRAFVDGVVAEAAVLPPRPSLDSSVDACAKSCESDRDCPRGARCTARENGALRCALSGFAPGALREACSASSGCEKDPCIALEAIGVAGGECRCYRACDAMSEQPRTLAGGGGCGVGAGGHPFALLLLLGIAALFRRNREFRT